MRAYEAGDPLKRVHWPATARTGQLQCKIYEPTTLTGATIVLDFASVGATENLMMAATLAQRAFGTEPGAVEDVD